MTVTAGPAEPFTPPPYPYDRLDELKPVDSALPGGVIDLSIGTPFDPPPPAVVTALGTSGADRGYPPSVRTPAYREAATGWMARRLGISVDPGQVAASLGRTALGGGVTTWLKRRRH